jgi:hypothetical protein
VFLQTPPFTHGFVEHGFSSGAVALPDTHSPLRHILPVSHLVPLIINFNEK